MVWSFPDAVCGRFRLMDVAEPNVMEVCPEFSCFCKTKHKKPTPAIQAIVSYFYTSLYSLPIFRALNFDLITLSKFLEVFSEHQWMYI